MLHPCSSLTPYGKHLELWIVPREQRLWMGLNLLQTPESWYSTLTEVWMECFCRRYYLRQTMHGTPIGKWFDNDVVRGKRRLRTSERGQRKNFLHSSRTKYSNLSCWCWISKATRRSCLHTQTCLSIMHSSRSLKQRRIGECEGCRGHTCHASSVRAA